MRKSESQKRGESAAVRRDRQKDWWRGATKERNIAVRLKAKEDRPL
jgi:hypothetical protein